MFLITLEEIAVSAADIPTDNPNGIKTLLAKGISTFFINGQPTVINFLVVPF